MKLTKLVLPALTALVWCSANTAQGQTAPILQFTEVSDSVLTVTLGGNSIGSVQNIGKDQWEWHSGIFLGAQAIQALVPLVPTLQWIEPENSSLVNTVSFGLFQSEIGALIISDAALIAGTPAFANGQAGGLLQLDGLVATPVFTDSGDQPSQLPDIGTTGALLFGASFVLLGLSRGTATARS